MSRGQEEVAARRIELDGAVNFRDLGGYRGSDGRRLRWGRLFRSDSLAELSERDLQRLGELGLRNLCDLRDESERLDRPGLLRADGLRIHELGFFPRGTEALARRVRARTIAAEEARHAMRTIYRRFPVEHVSEFARVLDVLTGDDALPALIHCTSGKDRTGFAVAVVLMAVGVARPTIVADYALSGRYRRDIAFMFGGDADGQVVEIVKAADAEFLEGAFHVIDEVWGGPEAFLRTGLGLTEDRQERLRAALLEPACRQQVAA